MGAQSDCKRLWWKRVTLLKEIRGAGTGRSTGRRIVHRKYVEAVGDFIHGERRGGVTTMNQMRETTK